VRIAVLTTDNREHYKDYDDPQPHFGAAPEALLEGFRERDDLEVHVISCLQEQVRSPERIGPNIWYHALEVPRVGWLRTGYQGCLRAVRRVLRQIGPDLVHGQGTERDCAFCAVLSGRPNVVTVHGNVAELARLFGDKIGSYAWFSAKLESFALKRTAGVFCNSAYTEKLVRERARRTWRVPNALREKFFSPASPIQRGERRIILNVGVISPRKRQLEVLEIGRRLHKEGLPLEFRFVGHAPEGDPYAREFLKQVNAAAESGYASYRGLLNLDEIVRCFDECDALVHFPTEEAFGLVVAEGLARNLRFFGSRTGGIVDIVENVPGATLHDVNDWSGLSGELEAWARAPRSHIDAATIMRARYAPQVVAQRHLEIYREVLKANPRR
jgi:glycosyltransferase involved in cell wall biosynthesis